ncbi:MAG: hypothetical protein ACRD0J_10650, partial [Acidimicrobiales bacterium]
DLVQACGDHILSRLRPRARALFRAGRFLEAASGTAVFALPGDAHRANCESSRGDVEAAISSHFGSPVRLHLVVDEAARPPADDEGGDDGARPSLAEVSQLPEAEVPPDSIEQRLLQAFPGATEVTEP